MEPVQQAEAAATPELAEIWPRLAAEAPVAMAVFDAADLRLIWANGRYQEFLAGQPRLPGVLRQVADSGTPWEEPEAAWSGTQGTRYLRWSVTPVRAGTGPVTHLATQALDCTAEVETRRLLDAVLQGMPAAVLIAEAPGGRIRLANPEASAVFPGPWLPCAEAQPCGRCALAAADGLAFRPENCPLRNCLQVGRPARDQEVRLRGAAGERTVRFSAAPALDGAGQLSAVVISFQDVSAEKQAQQRVQDLNDHLEKRTADLAAANQQLQIHSQELARVSRLKSEFLSSMSHELRAPLNAIVGFSDLLAEPGAGPLNQTQGRYVQHVREATRHLLELIGDVLDLSKIEAGRLELHWEAFAAEGAAAEVAAGLEPLAAARQIVCSSAIAAGCMVWADRTRFKQMLYNLLSNAVKFTPAGGRVTLRGEDRDEGVQFTVEDTGPGIPLEAQRRIFDAYQQVAAPRPGEGTGLGLTITRRLVEKHGGRIWVESQPGQGSRLSLWLPRAPRPQPAASSPWRHRPLVLIVDDDPAVRELLERYLEPEGYVTETAASGEEALLKARELRPDAITLDVLMPGRSGWETLRLLKSGAETAGIPVIMGSVLDEKEVGFALGAADCLLKPITKGMLLNALRSHVPPPRHGKLRVLVVDDDRDARALIGEILEPAGYQAVPAASGREALQVLAAQPIDAVILDLLMPEMDGFELLWRIRGEPRTLPLPVLVVTGKQLTAEEMQLLRRNTEACFRKSDEWKRGLLAQLSAVLPKKGTDAFSTPEAAP